MAENVEEQKKQAITIKEFHMWLEGVIEMQDPGWVPDARQWSKILGKIYDIGDAQQPVVQYQPAPGTVLPRAGLVEQPIVQPSQPQSYQMAAPGLTNVIPTPAILSGLLAGDGTGTTPIQTPNIDSSTGGYTTPFA